MNYRIKDYPRLMVYIGSDSISSFICEDQLSFDEIPFSFIEDALDPNKIEEGNSVNYEVFVYENTLTRGKKSTTDISSLKGRYSVVMERYKGLKDGEIFVRDNDYLLVSPTIVKGSTRSFDRDQLEYLLDPMLSKFNTFYCKELTDAVEVFSNEYYMYIYSNGSIQIQSGTTPNYNLYPKITKSKVFDYIYDL